MIDKYGADALRLYLINSPVVRAEPLRFREEGVFGVVKDVFMPWYNAYRFLAQNGVCGGGGRRWAGGGERGGGWGRGLKTTTRTCSRTYGGTGGGEGGGGRGEVKVESVTVR